MLTFLQEITRLCAFVITDQGYYSADFCDLSILQNYSCNTMLYPCKNATNNYLLQLMRIRLDRRPKLSGSSGKIYDPNTTD